MPPVWPRPRPESIGTKQPQAARIGAKTRLTLSPMPPVECLSTTGPGKPLQSQHPTAVAHRQRQRHGLVTAHAAPHHRHGEGADLGVTDAEVRDATH